MAAALQTTTTTTETLKVAIVLNDSNKEGGECVQIASNSTSIKIGRPGSTVSKKEYGPFNDITSSAASLFDNPSVAINKEIEESLREGTSFSLVSFGAKGQGKTTALWGSPALGPEQAIVPRVCGDLFSIIDKVKNKDDQVAVGVSFLRVSSQGGEMMNDCLNEDIDQSGLGLRLREVIHPILPLEFFLEGQYRKLVNNVSELSAIALDGLDRAEYIDQNDDQYNRGVRSHKLLTLTIIRKTISNDLYQSKLYFLDTVGIDREQVLKNASKPFNGKTALERKADMKSKKTIIPEDITIKAIIRCFDSLYNKTKHIPYRDSKLTRLLKSSLEDGRSVLIGCISTNNNSHAETDAMLQFFHKCSSLTSKQKPFVINPDIEISKREPKILFLANKLFDINDPLEAMKMLPSQVQCNMDSPPEMVEFCDLLTEVQGLRTDPMASLLNSAPAALP